MSNLFIPLYSKWYDQFVSGEKTIEYREYGPRWNENTCYPGRRVILSKGYGKKNRLEGRVKKFFVDNIVNPHTSIRQKTACIEIENIKSWNGRL